MSGKWKARKYDMQRMLNRLRALREDCKDQQLGVECEMITTMMSVVWFADSFDNGPRQKWSSNFGAVRLHLRKLLHALDHEFREDEGSPHPTSQSEKP